MGSGKVPKVAVWEKVRKRTASEMRANSRSQDSSLTTFVQCWCRWGLSLLTRGHRQAASELAGLSAPCRSVAHQPVSAFPAVDFARCFQCYRCSPR